jgi:superfamily II DNA or RNA helicase
MAEDRAVISWESPVWAHIDRPDLIDGYLRYAYEWWQQGQYRKERREARARLVDKKGYFLAGFVPRVQRYLGQRGVEVVLKGPDFAVPAAALTGLAGIAYREDQKRALQDILLAGRGVHQAPTGSGKTLLIAGLVASVGARSLVIVHTTALLTQTVAELSRWNKAVGSVGAGEWQLEPVTVAMRQTLAARIKDGTLDGDFSDRWGLVIVDEAHHVNALGGDYAGILGRVGAPLRVGFTATLPKTEEGLMAMEGLLGPPVGRTSYEELEKIDVLAKPRIRFYRVPENPKLRETRGSYAQVYDVVVVKNRRRNMLIVEKAAEQIEAGRSVLILVERIEHGERLMELLDAKAPGAFTFLQGSTEEGVRDGEKRAFELKKRMGVVATRVWSEGVNIRSVDVIVNAVGGESEIATIQRAGRGMRATDTKKEVTIIEFIDLNHRYMADHSLKRICTYSEWGWM